MNRQSKTGNRDPKCLIILSSSRKDSNTKLLAKKLFDDSEVEIIDLLDFKISHYDYQGNYPKTDQFFLIMEAMIKFENIIFASPVYWYSMSGLLKVFFDRLTDIVTIQKALGRRMKGKNIFLISVGAEAQLPNGFETPFRLTADYLGMNFIATYYTSTKNLSNKLADKTEFLNTIKNTKV